MMSQITFLGAAGNVTGSKHLVEINDKKILLDCGVWQGLPDMRERNRAFSFPPDEIDAVVLSHAHLDHSGMLPLLVKRGFRGPIAATPSTRAVVQHMLLDAAGIEVQDAQYRVKHHLGAPDEREPLFTKNDIPRVMNLFVDVPYARDRPDWHPLIPGVDMKMYDAGHILGSAVSVLRWKEGGAEKMLAYTGDLGPRGMPLLYDPQVPEEEIETLLLESTYGNRTHDSFAAVYDRLAETIKRVMARGGKMIVPSFSLGRTQVLVYVIHKLTDSGRIPRLPIYVDSPLATRITEVHRLHQDHYDAETTTDFGVDHAPLAFRNLEYVANIEESKLLNSKQGPFMVIAGSGMMTGGRVVHHLRHSISDQRNALFITGYQAEGTLGRRIIEGVPRVELYGDTFPVKMELVLFNEFSAHADAAGLADYAGAVRGVRRVFLVHGEAEQADALKQRLVSLHPHWDVQRPKEGKAFAL